MNASLYFIGSLPNRILYGMAGLNDGIVPTDSAWWGERLGVLDADHARQIGLRWTPSATYDAMAFFEAHCDALRSRGL